MQTLEEVAETLQISPEGLERESLEAFLEKKLREVEVELYRIGFKHGIKSVIELDDKLRKGGVREEEMREDFIEMDRLESTRDDILKAREKIR